MLLRVAHDLPAVHLLYLVEVLKAYGVSSGDFFGPLGIDEASLAHPGARVPLETMERVVDRARELSDGGAIGILIGMQMKASVFGQLGIAATSAPNLREALSTVIRYASTVTDTLDFRLTAEGGRATLRIDENVDFGRARDVVLFAITIGLWQMASTITGRPIEGTLGFAFPPPAYADDVHELARHTGGTIRFDEPANTVVFAAEMLDWPLVSADLAGHRLAREQCERALAARPSEAHVVQRVRALMATHEDTFPTLEEVAVTLHSSTRTLKRRLADHDRTYSQLLDEARRERATSLLTATALAIKEIASRVGYSEVANFTRAFRRWTGSSPALFRRKVASPPPSREVVSGSEDEPTSSAPKSSARPRAPGSRSGARRYS